MASPRQPGSAVHNRHYDLLRELLIESRARKGVGLREMSRRLERPPSFTAKYESGYRRIDVMEFIEIAEALDLEPTELFAELLRRRTQEPPAEKPTPFE